MCLPVPQGGLPLCPEPSRIESSAAHLPQLELDALRTPRPTPPSPPQARGGIPTCSVLAHRSSPSCHPPSSTRSTASWATNPTARRTTGPRGPLAGHSLPPSLCAALCFRCFEAKSRMWFASQRKPSKVLGTKEAASTHHPLLRGTLALRGQPGASQAQARLDLGQGRQGRPLLCRGLPGLVLLGPLHRALDTGLDSPGGLPLTKGPTSAAPPPLSPKASQGLPGW